MTRVNNEWPKWTRFNKMDNNWTQSSSSLRVCTCEVEGKGDKAMVFAEDAKRLLPLHQWEEVICHSFTIEEVVHTQQEVPVGKRGWSKCTHLTVTQLLRLCIQYACRKTSETFNLKNLRSLTHFVRRPNVLLVHCTRDSASIFHPILSGSWHSECQGSAIYHTNTVHNYCLKIKQQCRVTIWFAMILLIGLIIYNLLKI